MYNRIVNPTPQYAKEKENPLAPKIQTAPYVTTSEVLDAIVVDVVTNEDHPEHISDGYNVGAIKFRAFKTHYYRPTDLLHWAYPIEANIEEFPLKNEIVRVFRSMNRFYYTRKVNLGNNASHQAFFGIRDEVGTRKSSKEKIDKFETSTYAPQNETRPPEKLGEYFIDKKVPHLRHWEGDHIVEGRSGQSIRLGHSWTSETVHKGLFQSKENDQSPNILIRVGPGESVPKSVNSIYGRSVEDINLDHTSMWLVSDQIVNIKLATSNDDSIHLKSVSDFPSQLDGNQLIANSGRIIINAKRDKIILNSLNGIHFNTLKNTTIDTKNDFLSYSGRDSKHVVKGDSSIDVHGISNIVSEDTTTISSNDKISVIAPKIFVGSEEDTSEPLVLGNTLVRILEKIIDAHLNYKAAYVQTPSGPGSLLGTAAELAAVKAELKTILSDDNFVSDVNSDPLAPRNEN